MGTDANGKTKRGAHAIFPETGAATTQFIWTGTTFKMSSAGPAGVRVKEEITWFYLIRKVKTEIQWQSNA